MSLLGGAGALAVALVLLAAGVGHLRDRRSLRAALAAHRALPAGLQRPLASLLGPVELALGAALLVLLASGDPVGAPFRAVALGAVLLTGAFTGYLLLVLRRTGGAEEIPCGCGLGTTPVGPWAVARAGLLTGLASVALLGGTPGWAEAGAAATTGAPVWAQAFLVTAAGTTLAIAVAALPAARAVPSSLTTLHTRPAPTASTTLHTPVPTTPTSAALHTRPALTAPTSGGTR